MAKTGRMPVLFAKGFSVSNWVTSWMTDFSVRGTEAAPGSNASISEGGMAVIVFVFFLRVKNHTKGTRMCHGVSF